MHSVLRTYFLSRAKSILFISNPREPFHWIVQCFLYKMSFTPLKKFMNDVSEKGDNRVCRIAKFRGKIDLGWNFQPLQKKFDSMSVFGG